jgi:hypothetical protein
MSALHMYIYYQVADLDAAAMAGRVRAMQAALGVGAVQRRPVCADGKQTWMEIYPAVAEDFSVPLAAAVADARLLELTAGPRHTELFTELDPMESSPCA